VEGREKFPSASIVIPTCHRVLEVENYKFLYLGEVIGQQSMFVKLFTGIQGM
jgi:hypothetical protein